MLDECHHLSLKPLGVNILYRGHLQENLDVRVPLQGRVRLSKSEKRNTMVITFFFFFFKKTTSFRNYMIYNKNLLKLYIYVYLWILKMRASPPRVVNLSLKRSPCGVRSLRDKLPKLPCKAMSPSASIGKIMFTKLFRKFIKEKSRGDSIQARFYKISPT